MFHFVFHQKSQLYLTANQIFITMKSKIVFQVFSILVLVSCSVDDNDYVTIKGKVERKINREGIANQLITVMTRKSNGSGLFSYISVLDSTAVMTDANGDFSANLSSDSDAFVTTVYQGGEDYEGFGIYRDHFINEPIILKVDKYVKFKIFVNNSNPFDDNDFIKINFFAGLSNVKRTNIENFGLKNTYHPIETLPGGGSIGPWDEASWIGVNVNSIVYYSVPESATDFKIRWYMTKNNVSTEGFSDEIPHVINEENTFSFEY